MSMFLPITILKEPYFILSDSIFVNRVQTYFHAVPSKMVKTEGKARCLKPFARNLATVNCTEKIM